MAFKLRSIDVTATGREIVRDTDLAAGVLTVGRSSDCDIHLPDLALESRHARISLLEGGRVAIEAIMTVLLFFSVTQATWISPIQSQPLRLRNRQLRQQVLLLRSKRDVKAKRSAPSRRKQVYRPNLTHSP